MRRMKFSLSSGLPPLLPERKRMSNSWSLNLCEKGFYEISFTIIKGIFWRGNDLDTPSQDRDHQSCISEIITNYCPLPLQGSLKVYCVLYDWKNLNKTRPAEMKGRCWQRLLGPEKINCQWSGWKISYSPNSTKNIGIGRRVKLTFGSFAIALYLALPSFHPPIANETWCRRRLK